jgi:3-deoxy-D-manno-octulosonate 8-phosphate phosphatase KdsC-like HAD superfamily phosphatase
MEGQILSKTFSDLDTLGIKLAKYFGVRFVIVTGDKRINENFARLHDIEFIHTFKSKYKALRNYIALNGWDIDDSEICYLGNDINDLDCIEAFYSIVPSKTTPRDIANRARACTEFGEPGHDFVRTILDSILVSKGITLDDKFEALKVLNKWNEES